MKKRMIASIKAEKAKRMSKHARLRSAVSPKDPRDLRGPKGALLKRAAEDVLTDEFRNGQTDDGRYPPGPIRDDW